MGQLIEVDRLVLGDVAVFDTDRSFSGQEGETYTTSAADADASEHLPRAGRERALRRVPLDQCRCTCSPTPVSVRNSEGWDDEQADAAAGIIRNSLVYYASNRL